MKIGIVGTGISGLVVAHLLGRDHELTLFEADARIGGHTHTVRVDDPSGSVWVDTGFIVLNDWTYPNFIRLLRNLGVRTRPTRMHFSVRDEERDLEYSVAGLDGIFAQRRNLLSLRHHRLFRRILSFGAEARRFLASGRELTLGELAAEAAWDEDFLRLFIVPMGAAIWSAERNRLLDFPARTVLRFYDHHGMLNLYDQPDWRVIEGGSRSYVEPLIAPFKERIQLESPVERVRRDESGVTVTSRGAEHRFDELVLACHSDQALRILGEDASEREREILGAIGYQRNEAVLHTDRSLMPRRRRAWAAWNYHVVDKDGPVPVTYAMNLLQHLKSTEQYFVTLNRTEHIDPSRVLRRIEYHHPILDQAAVRAQARYDEIGGVQRTHFAGAYWFDGFHEDGVESALRVARRFGAWLR